MLNPFVKELLDMKIANDGRVQPRVIAKREILQEDLEIEEKIRNMHRRVTNAFPRNKELGGLNHILYSYIY